MTSVRDTGSGGGAPEPTPAQTEGPNFKAGSPERASLLEPGMAGTRLTLTGRVLSTRGEPVAGARLDFWQTDDSGRYDAAGYRLRGHQLADASGAFRLETIVPAPYPERTRHLHVKVRAPDGPELTTELYFPGEGRNASDEMFHPGLLLDVVETGSGCAASFDFVLDV